MSGPLCFVLMPFGTKPDSAGALIDFDVVYRDLIAPAIRDAELEPLRADEVVVGGIIHEPMFERLVLCEFAVAYLTTANVVREPREPETTARNLRLIREARDRRGAPVPWAADVEKELEMGAAMQARTRQRN